MSKNQKIRIEKVLPKSGVKPRNVTGRMKTTKTPRVNEDELITNPQSLPLRLSPPNGSAVRVGVDTIWNVNNSSGWRNSLHIVNHPRCLSDDSTSKLEHLPL